MYSLERGCGRRKSCWGSCHNMELEAAKSQAAEGGTL